MLQINSLNIFLTNNNFNNKYINFKNNYNNFNNNFNNNYNNKFLTLKNNVIELINNDILLSNNCKIYYESRIKTFNKICYKFLYKNKIPNDIYGLRIIYNLNNNSKNYYYAYYIENLIKTNYLTIDYFYDDYIKFPKKNNYKSIHLYILNELIMEIQIRDIYMHINAVNGSASNYY